MAHVHVEPLAEREGVRAVVQCGVDRGGRGCDVLLIDPGDDLLEVSNALGSTWSLGISSAFQV